MSALRDVVRGDEWVVEAFGCDAGRLADRATLAALLDRIVNELGLRPVGTGQWHVFPPPSGVTGMLLLAESHISVHAWPEHRFAAFDVFMCGSAVVSEAVAAIAQAFPEGAISTRIVERGAVDARRTSPRQ